MFVKSAIMAGNDRTSYNASCPEKPEVEVEKWRFLSPKFLLSEDDRKTICF